MQGVNNRLQAEQSGGLRCELGFLQPTTSFSSPASASASLGDHSVTLPWAPFGILAACATSVNTDMNLSPFLAILLVWDTAVRCWRCATFDQCWVVNDDNI
jgi:hypothetical protein